MNHEIVNKNFWRRLVIIGICFLFMGISLTPVLSQTTKGVTRTNEGDIPTWAVGDEWTYTVNPLSFSSSNGSFDGSIENFRQTVVGITDDTYTISITGDISGMVDVSGFQGDLSGVIVGQSHMRVSDVAEETTELHSTGTITYLWLTFDYQLDMYMSSSPDLEVYDFPIQVEQWQLSGSTTISGSFIIEGVLNQPFDENQWIDETVECIAQEPLTVPAGTFDCSKIGRETTLTWFSTDVGNMVKTTVDQESTNLSLQMITTLQSYSLIDQPILVSEDISPSITVPGASVLVSGVVVSSGSGDPIQNGAISITIPSTGASWSTTTNSAGQYFITIVAPTMIDDTLCGRETGSGGVVVRCSSGGLSGYRVQTLTTLQDTPPATPSIHGLTEGKPMVSYSYSIVTVDSENDDVLYFIDWGDGTNSSWLGPYDSNQNITIDHTFAKKGSYTIKVQAMDFYGALSDWGTLDVTMPTVASAFLMKLFSRFPLFFYLLHQLLGK